jgi:hypothetical protein
MVPLRVQHLSRVPLSTTQPTLHTLVPPERFELPTSRLQGESSTTELQGHDMAIRSGLEPLASTVTGWRSNQLN